MDIRVQLPHEVHRELWRHLLSEEDGPEEVAFVFARESTDRDTCTLEYIEWLPVPPNGFTSRSAFHLELNDETRGAVIKKAHDLGALLIEFHSHRGNWPARFSLSDWQGFEEFVPHVLWRLKERPYAAAVVTSTGFDALAWLNRGEEPIRVSAVIAGNQVLTPTHLSPVTRNGYDTRG